MVLARERRNDTYKEKEMKEPNCKDCPIGEGLCVGGLGTRTEGSKLLAVRDENAQFDLVLVGMYPADNEVAAKMPMVGASGQLLRKILKQLGIDRYYITNSLACPLPIWAKAEQTSKAVECCKARLESEILAHNPKLIIALGDMPLAELVGESYPILEVQGRMFMSKLNIPLVPIPNPAYYLQNSEEGYDLIESLRVGVRYLSGNYHQAGEVTRTVVTLENVDAIVAKLEKKDTLVVDAETSGLYALGIHPDYMLELGIAADEKQAYIIPITDSTNYRLEGASSLHPDYTLLMKFKPLLETKKIRTWNGFFDGRFLKAVGILINHYFDGMLAHYRLDERPTTHGLKRIARLLIGAPDWEASIKKYVKKKEDSYALIPTEVRWDYLSKDVCYTWQLCDMLEEEMKNDFAFWNVLMPATRMFTESTFRGLRIDPDKVLVVLKELQEDLERDKKELVALAEKEFNPRSAIQCIPIIFDKFKIPPHPKYGRSTNKKVMEEYRDKYPFVDKLISYRENAHDISNYIEGFVYRIDNNFMVHPTIKMFGTVTGRISSSDPSIMNIKNGSKICQIVVALQGRYIGVFDAKGMELRWFYIYARDEVLKDILVNGYKGDLGFPLTDKQKKDPHYMIGAIAFGPDRANELRLAAKTIVFGRIYMRGLKSIEDMYGKTTAYKLVDTMSQIVPKQPKYVNDVKKELREKGYVESWFGRQRRFPIITSENRNEVERRSCNMKIQSAGSDLNLLNAIHLDTIAPQKWDSHFMFTIHDSIVVDMPSPDVVPEIQAELEKHAAVIVKDEIPFPYEAKWGTSWTLHGDD